MKKIKFLKSFFLIISDDSLKIKYSTYLKKKYFNLNINKLSRSNLNFKFELGYNLQNNSGEYAFIEIKDGKLKITSDFVSSYPIYYNNEKNSLILTTNIRLIHKIKKHTKKISTKNLLDFYMFGFNASTDKTIYNKIEVIKPDSQYIFFNNKMSKKKLSFSKIKIKKLDMNIYFNYLVKKKEKLLSFDKSILAITDGVDSNMLARKLKHNNIAFDCGNIGRSNSNDVLGGKENSMILKRKFRHFPQNYTSKKNLLKLLLEYANSTFGIGTSSEIFMLEFIKNLSKNYNFIFLGGGGEFYRNYFKNIKYFHSNYLTKKSTLKKFIKNKFFLKSEIDRKKIKDTNFSLEDFYINKRYPKNTSRKYQFIKNYLFPINFFVDETLYKTYKKNRNRPKKSNLKFFENIVLKQELKTLKLKKIEAFNLKNFFKLVKPVLIKELNIIKKENEFLIDKDKTLRIIKSDQVSTSDKWFLLRILNLLIYNNVYFNHSNFSKL